MMMEKRCSCEEGLAQGVVRRLARLHGRRRRCRRRCRRRGHHHRGRSRGWRPPPKKKIFCADIFHSEKNLPITSLLISFFTTSYAFFNYQYTWKTFSR